MDFHELQPTTTIMHLCEEYYDSETLAHAYRVEHLVSISPHFSSLSPDEQEFARHLALCHDLFEDTDINPMFFGGDLQTGIRILTRKKNETYLEYVSRVRQQGKIGGRIGYIAYLVKLADMCDHFLQKDTLTDNLRSRYTDAISYLL